MTLEILYIQVGFSIRSFMPKYAVNWVFRNVRLFLYWIVIYGYMWEATLVLADTRMRETTIVNVVVSYKNLHTPHWGRT